jgi:YbbR domain-containing protein
MHLLFGNWHLKLSAVALATVLYTGLVFTGAFTEGTWRGVPASLIEQPEGTHRLAPSHVPTVDVRYRVAREIEGRINTDSFVATVDLSRYDVERAGQPQSLPISVSSLSDEVSVLDWSPREVTVNLDELASKVVRVEVDRGQIPEGLEIGESAVSDDEVEVTGPRSRVRLVDRAVARVSIDPSGLDVRRQVDLEPVDVDGQRVDDVDVSPASVEVNIAVRTSETTRTVPIRADVSGSPAQGFAVGSVTVEPSVTTILGQPGVLEEIVEVLTEEVSVAGATSDQTFEVQLVLPETTRLADEQLAEVIVSVSIVATPASRTFVAGVVCDGVAAGNACLPLLDRVSVTLSGPPDLLDTLGAADLTPVLDVSGLAPGTHTVAAVLAVPAGAELVTISPSNVQVEIVAPQTPQPTPAPTPVPTPTPEP